MSFRFLITAALFGAHVWLIASPTQTGSAVIVNSGSTNTPGYRIVVSSDGVAECSSTPRGHQTQNDQHATTPIKRQLPPALAHGLYSDLEAACPFSELRRPHCVKGVSLGTPLTIQFYGEETPDLNCRVGQNAKLTALSQDANQIVEAFSTH